MTDGRAGAPPALAAPPLRRRLTINTLHAASGRMATIVVWLLLTPAVLRALGPDGFAIWSLFFALTGYLAALDLGLTQATLRQVAAAVRRGVPADASAFAGMAAAGYVALGVVWFVVVAAAGGPIARWLHVPPDHHAAALFALHTSAVVFVLAGCSNVVTAFAQGHGRFDIGNLVVLAQAASQAIGIPLALHAHAGLAGLVLVVAIGWLVAFVLGLVLLRRALPGVPVLAIGDVARHLRDALRLGGPMQVASMLATVHAHVDKFLLARLVALATVTPYEVGFRVAAAAAALPQMLLLAVLPVAAGLHVGLELPRLRRLYDRGSRYVLAAGAVLLAVQLAAADRLMLAWLGPGHADESLALRGLAIGASIALVTGMGTSIVRAAGRPEYEAWYAAVVVIAHVAISLWAIPQYGLRGALAAGIVASVVGAVFFLVQVAPVLGMSRGHLLAGIPLVPALAAAAGGVAGGALARWLPVAAGAAAWLPAIAVSAAAAAVAGGIMLALRYVDARELAGIAGPPAAEAP